MSMDGLIGEEKKRYYVYMLDACLGCLCDEDQRETTRAKQLQRRQQVPQHPEEEGQESKSLLNKDTPNSTLNTLESTLGITLNSTLNSTLNNGATRNAAGRRTRAGPTSRVPPPFLFSYSCPGVLDGGSGRQRSPLLQPTCDAIHDHGVVGR